jgi:hypothetical protein
MSAFKTRFVPALQKRGFGDHDAFGIRPDQRPVPMRQRASVGLLPLSGILLGPQVGAPGLIAKSKQN